MKTLDDLVAARDTHAAQLRRLATGKRDEILRAFGLDSFRPLQEPAIAAAIAHRDSLVVMPTGGGKSLCFQAPALFDDGLTVVVSPLISLMKDQVDRQCGTGILPVDCDVESSPTPLHGKVAYLNSSLPAAMQIATERDLRRGKYRILYVAPEKFNNPAFLGLLSHCRVNSIVIDEAHCITQWGHDFRPAYANLGALRTVFPDASIHAYTATATPSVRDQIVESLHLKDPEILVGDFDRPNLTLRVVPRVSSPSRLPTFAPSHSSDTVTAHNRSPVHAQIQRELLAAFDRAGPGSTSSAIVYCMTRKDTERVAEDLALHHVYALPYHAGLDDDTRTHNQEAFMSGDCNVIVATTAFGMGIDKPDIRAVIHASMPASIEQYHQEIGRAGRDGKPAECVFLYDAQDYDRWIRVMELRDELDSIEAAHGDPFEIVPALGRLAYMAYEFCENDSVCRHAQIVNHFGQDHPDHCNACDICLKGES